MSSLRLPTFDRFKDIAFPVVLGAGMLVTPILSAYSGSQSKDRVKSVEKVLTPELDGSYLITANGDGFRQLIKAGFEPAIPMDGAEWQVFCSEITGQCLSDKSRLQTEELARLESRTTLVRLKAASAARSMPEKTMARSVEKNNKTTTDRLKTRMISVKSALEECIDFRDRVELSFRQTSISCQREEDHLARLEGQYLPLLAERMETPSLKPYPSLQASLEVQSGSQSLLSMASFDRFDDFYGKIKTRVMDASAEYGQALASLEIEPVKPPSGIMASVKTDYIVNTQSNVQSGMGGPYVPLNSLDTTFAQAGVDIGSLWSAKVTYDIPSQVYTEFLMLNPNIDQKLLKGDFVELKKDENGQIFEIVWRGASGNVKGEMLA